VDRIADAPADADPDRADPVDAAHGYADPDSDADADSDPAGRHADADSDAAAAVRRHDRHAAPDAGTDLHSGTAEPAERHPERGREPERRADHALTCTAYAAARPVLRFRRLMRSGRGCSVRSR